MEMGRLNHFVILALISLPTLAFSVNPIELLAKGDTAYRNRQQREKAFEALDFYQKATSLAPDSVEAQWRYSMACHFVGMRLATSQEKESYFLRGREAGLRSIQLDPHCAACHFWTAINQALYGENVGIFKMLFSLKEVEEHLRQTVILDANYAEGGALRVLGAIRQKLPGILGGSNREAQKFYEAAIEAAPLDPLNYLFLARILAEEQGNVNTAAQIAKRGLDLPEPASDHLESREAIEELKALLSILEQASKPI